MFFPFMMDLSGKRVVIVGGGAVALRKCKLFQRFGAHLTINAPAVCPELQALPGVEVVQDEYHEEILEGAFAVVAATDDRRVNREVSAGCARRQIPVNVVDVPELCSFIVPSTVVREDLVLAVSTGGQCPAFAARIHRDLEKVYSEEYGTFLSLLGRVRKALLHSNMPPAERKDLLLKLAELPVGRTEVLEEQLSSLQGAEESCPPTPPL